MDNLWCLRDNKVGGKKMRVKEGDRYIQTRKKTRKGKDKVGSGTERWEYLDESKDGRLRFTIYPNNYISPEEVVKMYNETGNTPSEAKNVVFKKNPEKKEE